MSLGVLLLAAGQSRRFGPQDKLMALLGTRPLVAHALTAAALPEAQARLAVISSDAVAAVANQAGFKTLAVAPGLPQADSLTAGLADLRGRGISQLVVVLGDMPWVLMSDIRALLALAGPNAACAVCNGVPSPPAVFPGVMFDALAGLTGDRGAGRLLQAIPPTQRLQLPAKRLRDVDVIRDLTPDPPG